MKYAEDDLQMAVARYLDHSSMLWFHPANERKSSPQAGARLKRKGVKSGVPDVMIFEPSGKYIGLAIELKVKTDNGLKKNGQPSKPTLGKLSENQQKWLCDLYIKGWFTSVAYSLDEAIEIIEKYKQLNKGL